MTTDFERIGGAQALREIIEDFTARVFSDVMIGFLFHGKDHARITEMEYLFAARHLGAGVAYPGRTIRNAHRSSPIMGGHFMRRRQILANTLRDHGVAATISASWLAHVDSLRDQVLAPSTGEGSECDHAEQLQRVGASPQQQQARHSATKSLPIVGD